MSILSGSTPRSSFRGAGLSIDRPVRILHVIPELLSGGMERAMLRMIRRSILHDRHTRGGSALQHGLCILKSIKPGLIDECPSEVPIWELGGKQHAGRYGTWRRLRGVVKSFGPDVIHARSTGTWFDATAAAARLAHVHVLLSFHGRTSLETPNWRRRLVDRWATNRASAVLTVSTDSACMLHSELGVPRDKLVTIYNGVDTQRFCPSECEGEILETRQNLRLHSSADVAICVANLMPIKGLDVLIRAWRQIHMANPLARLLLVGEGPLREQLETLIRELRCSNFIRLLGSRDDIAPLLRAADVFVLPSLYEGCSNATLEAMASGLPVVAGDVAGMREVVTHNHSGWLVPPGNIEKLGETLLAVLLDRSLRSRAGAAGRDKVVKSFGIDTWVAKHAALYRRLAGVRPPQHIPQEGLLCVE